MGFPGPNSQTMADEAFNAVKDNINFNQYDDDGNGYVRILLTEPLCILNLFRSTLSLSFRRTGCRGDRF